MDFIANLIAPNHKSNSSAQSKSTKPFSSTSERMEQVHVFKEGEIIGDFTVKKRLGEGGCGVVYKVLDKQNQPYAMKVEPSTRKKTDQLLPLEAQILKRLQFSPYASEFVLYAKTPDFRVLVMGLLGPSLTQLQDEQTGYKFSIGTVLRIGLQSLRAIAFLHSIWFVHRDIKPSNFAIDLKNCRRIYLIDYGLSRSLKKRGTQKLRKPRDDVPFRGTPGYCSLNAHMRKEHGRHDDLWSMIYMLVDMVSGTLPWFKHSRASTALLKQSLMDFEYMFDCPVAFSTILNYLRALNYYQRPDYVGMEVAFIQMMRLRDVNESQPMDWEINSLKKDQQGKSIRPYTKALLEPPADQAADEGSGSGSGASGTLKYTYSNKSDSS